MRTNALLPLVFLSLLLLPSGADAGLDAYGTRQSAGIFVTVDGGVHSIYLDFDAVEVRDAEQPVPVTLSTDIDLWIEGHAIPSGKYEWTLVAPPSAPWSLGEGAKKKSKDDPLRFLVPTRENGQEDRWLTAYFSPEPATESVILHLRFGGREAGLRLALRKVEGPAEGAAPAADIVELRSLRDRLLDVAGRLEGPPGKRHAWSSALLDVGDAFAASGGGWLAGADLARDGDRLALTIRGRLPADRSGVDAVVERLSKGEIGRLFDHVGKAIPHLLDKNEGWSFELSADGDPSAFDKTSPVAAMADGDDPASVAEEILLLEERLGRLCSGAAEGLATAQSILLAAKRESGVLLSRIEPGEAAAGTEGLTNFPIVLTAAGSGSALVSFVRALEEDRAPKRLMPVSIGAGDYGPQLRLRITFLGYRPLSERNPRLFAEVRTKGMGPSYDVNKAMYLRGVGSSPSVPFRRPAWSSDPFAPPKQQ